MSEVNRLMLVTLLVCNCYLLYQTVLYKGEEYTKLIQKIKNFSKKKGTISLPDLCYISPMFFIVVKCRNKNNKYLYWNLKHRHYTLQQPMFDKLR